MKHVSASQVSTFRRCKRRWHWEYVGGHKQPPTPSQALGTAIHSAMEHYVQTGEIKTTVDGIEVEKFVRALSQHVEHDTTIEVERSIELKTFPKGPKWVGYIDYWDTQGTIRDYKTTSNLRYAKTPHELENDIQSCAYAYAWLLHHPERDSVRVVFTYAETRNKKTKTTEVEVNITRQHAEAAWQDALSDVRDMVKLYKNKDSLSVDANPEACNDYGGCPHKTRCGIIQSLFGEDKTSNKAGGNFVSKFSFLKQKAEAAKAEAEQSDAAEPNTIEPGATDFDVGGFTGMQQEAAPAPEPKKKTKKKTKAEPAAPVAPEKTGFYLYIDCMPIRGNYVLFEDWIQPVIDELNEQVRTEQSLPDYRLLKYGEEKASLAEGVRQYVEQVGYPEHLVCSTFSGSTKDVLPMLIPRAKQIIRGMR